MRQEPLEPAPDLDQEGIPEMETPYPGERATGVRWDETMAPGDQPVGADEFGTTAAEERMDEPLAVRVQREEPDVVAGGGDLREPGDLGGDLIGGGPGDDLGGELVDDVGVSARIVAPDDGLIDEEADVVGQEAHGDTGALSAEESAMHVIGEDDAPGLSWDASPGYLDGASTGDLVGSQDRAEPGD